MFLWCFFFVPSRGSSGGSMAERQNSFEVSVKRLLLIRFICSATSEPFVHAELPNPQPSQGFSVVEQRCKGLQTVKKKPSGWGDLYRGGGLGGEVVLGNQNDGQQWEVFCGLPHTCKVARPVSFHSSLWSSGKHWLTKEGLVLPLLSVCVLVFVYANNVFVGLFVKGGSVDFCVFASMSVPRVSVFNKFTSVVIFSIFFCLWYVTVDARLSRWNKQHPYFMKHQKNPFWIRHRLRSKDTVKWTHNCSSLLWANIIILFSYAFHLALSA